MPKRNAVELLPPAVKEWLDRALVEGGFSGYRLLADELQTRGYDISKSAVHRYGQSFEEKMDRLKLATEQARAVVAASPDDAGHMGEALTRLVQTQTFDLLMKLDVEGVDPDKINLAALGKMVADLNKASVAQKKWQAEVQARARDAAAEVEQVARAGGLTDAAVETIRAKILGIA